MKIKGNKAIEAKASNPSVILNKYADPTQEGLYDISLEEAWDVAREDPSLIWAEIEDDPDVVVLEGVDTVVLDDVAYKVRPGYGPGGDLTLLQGAVDHMNQMVYDPETNQVCKKPQGADGQPWKGGDREVFGEWVMVTWEWEPEGF